MRVQAKHAYRGRKMNIDVGGVSYTVSFDKNGISQDLPVNVYDALRGMKAFCAVAGEAIPTPQVSSPATAPLIAPESPTTVPDVAAAVAAEEPTTEPVEPTTEPVEPTVAPFAPKPASRRRGR